MQHIARGSLSLFSQAMHCFSVQEVLSIDWAVHNSSSLFLFLSLSLSLL